MVFGDLMRGDKEWDERIGAVAEGQGLNVSAGPGETAPIAGDAAILLHADLFDAREGLDVGGQIVHSYTSMTTGPVFENARSMVTHSFAIGVLTERQRWDGEAAAPLAPPATPKDLALLRLQSGIMARYTKALSKIANGDLSLTASIAAANDELQATADLFDDAGAMKQTVLAEPIQTEQDRDVPLRVVVMFSHITSALAAMNGADLSEVRRHLAGALEASGLQQ